MGVRRIVTRVIGWMLLGVVALVIVALATVFIGIRTERGSRFLLGIGLGYAHKYLAAQITVGRMRTNLWSDLVLEDVEMRDVGGELAARIDKLTVRFDLVPLMHRTLRVAYVNIEGGRARARYLSDGRLNFAALVRETPEAPLPPRPDEPSSPFRVQIDEVHADVIGRFEPTKKMGIPPLEARLVLGGAVGIGGGDVTVKLGFLTAQLTQPAPATVIAFGGLVIESGKLRFEPSKVTVDAAGSALRPFGDGVKLEGRYHVEADAKGALDALALTAVVYTPSKPVYVDGQLALADVFGWKGHVHTRGLDPARILANVPHASVWVDAQASGDGTRGQFAVAHAQVEADGNRVHASGKLALDPALRADLALDIDARDLSRLHGPGFPKLGGAVKGHSKLRLVGSVLDLDTALVARDLVAPGVRAAELNIQAKTRNLAGHVVVRARDLVAGRFALAQSRIQIDGDKQGFFLRASSAGNARTSFELGLRGTPHYGDGPIPTGVSAVLTTLDVARNGESWHTDPGAKLSYGLGLRIEQLSARSEKQGFTVNGRFDPARSEIDATVTGKDLDVHRLVALFAPADAYPHSSLSFSLHAAGPIAHPRAELGLTGTVTRDPAKPDDRLAIALDAKLDPSFLVAKATGDTRAGTFALDASVPYARSTRALFDSTAPVTVKSDVKVSSLTRLYAVLGIVPPARLAALEGRVALSMSLSGTPRRPKLGLELEGDDLRYGSLQKATLRTHVDLARDDLKSQLVLSLGGDGDKSPAGRISMHVSSPLSVARFLAGTTLLDRLGPTTLVDVGVKAEGLALAVLPLGALGVPTVDGGTLDGELLLSGTYRQPRLQVVLNGKGLRRGLVEGVDFQLGVDAANRATLVAGKVAVQRSPLVVLDGKLALDASTFLEGAAWKTTPIAAKMTFPGFDLRKLAAMIPGLAGKLVGDVTADGTFAAPRAKAKLRVDDFEISGEKVDKLELAGVYTGDKIEADLKAHEPRGGVLHGSIVLEGGQIDARLAATAFMLAFESDGEGIPIRRLRGALNADLRISGARSSPTLAGRLAIDKATLAIVADPREITGMALHLGIEPGQLQIETLTGKLGPGHFVVTGGAALAGLVPKNVDLVVKTTQLPALQTPLSVAVTSKITIHGSQEGRTLKGTVLVEDGAAKLPTLTNVRNLQSTGALKDVVYIDAKGRAEIARKAAEPPEEALAIEIETKIPGPFHVRSKEVQVDLEGALRVEVKGADVRLRGSVSSMGGGRLELFGKRYEIDHIRVGFNGRKNINPSLDVKITRELTAARIGVEVTGTANKPVPRFFAEPPIYSDGQVIQAMLGGDPGEPSSDRGLDQKITGAIAGLLVGVIKDQLAPQLPIDVIKVDTGDGDNGGLGSTRIEVGKYITESIYVSYVHQFGQTQIGTRRLSQNQGDFEYRFRRRYALDLSIGDAPAGKADLFWTLRF